MAVSKRRADRSGRGRMFLLVVAVISLMIAYVGMQMYILSLENRVRESRGELSRTRELVEEREMKVAELMRGSRIKRIAREKLDMKVPEGAPEKLF